MENYKLLTKYKKFQIKWYEGGLKAIHAQETLTITPKSITFKRKTNGYVINKNTPYWSDCDYKIIVNDNRFIEKFEKLCDCFIITKDPDIIVKSTNGESFYIEITYYVNEKVKKEYDTNLTTIGLDKLIKNLNQFIPKSCSKPYFINGIYE